MKKVYHQCKYGELLSGHATDCRRCRYGKLVPKREYFPPQAKHTWEEARLLIDRCECGKPIPEDHPHHKCKECEPAWRKRVALLDKLYLEANPWECENGT